MKNKFKQISRKVKKYKLPYPIHPFLFAILPILFIYANNLDQVFMSEMIFPIIISLAVTTFVFFTLKFILKDINKTAFVTTVSLIIFFSYGHIFSLIEAFEINGIIIGRNKVLLPLSIILLLTIFVLTNKSKTDFQKISKFLNFIVVTFILVSLVTIGNFAFSNNLKLVEPEIKKSQTENLSINNDSTNKLPDIYYIILDGYAREDTLKAVHDYDNSDFIKSLEKRGFYVAGKSQSNYSITQLSLPSSLNMNYLEHLDDNQITNDKKFNITQEQLRNNEATEFLKNKGYTIINITTGWRAIHGSPLADQIIYDRKQLSEFIEILLHTTALITWERLQVREADAILYGFDKLSDIPKTEKPTFTFAHFITPHFPYVFDRDGNKTPPGYTKKFAGTKGWKEKDRYIDQLVFINSKILDVIDEIFSKSDISPIIIIQSDHGTASMDQMEVDLGSITKTQFNERMGILNAYFLPNGGNKILYETITPVNSFRKVFNYYFKANYKILDDVSYFSQHRNISKSVVAPKEIN